MAVDWEKVGETIMADINFATEVVWNWYGTQQEIWRECRLEEANKILFQSCLAERRSAFLCVLQRILELDPELEKVMRE